MLLNDVEIIIYEISNSKFEPIGPVNKYTAVVWPEAFVGCGQFEIWAPINEENNELFKKGNFVWCGRENAGVIEIIEQEIDRYGNKTYDIKGRTLEKLLTDRIIWGTMTFNGKVSSLMYEMVKNNCVNPTDTKRKIPYLECYADEMFGDTISYQKTGGTVYDNLEELANAHSLGFSINIDIPNSKLIFKVEKGRDLSVNNTEGNIPVELSTDLSDILESEYYSNAQDVKNVAFIQGEGEGAIRRNTTSGDDNLTGLERKELYVDARDLQSEVHEDSGETRQIPEAEYLQMLVNRGNEKLGECVLSETFSAKIRQFAIIQYRYGVDYLKGDKITVVDKNLNVTVDAVVSNVEHQYDNEYNLEITFGFLYPTILQKVNRLSS